MPRFTAYVVALLMTWSRLASAQALDSDYVERGPRFLLASAAAPVPVRVDVTRTPVLRQSISLDLNGVALGDALREISAKAGMQLAFSNTMLPAERTVTFRADHITVAAALTELLIDTQVDVLFSRDGRAVLVRRAEPFQGGAVIGKVTDAKTGKAIPGVSVYLEGTRWRASTGEDGAYHLRAVAPGTYMVRAHYIGYATGMVSVTVSADHEATADFALENSALPLDQVVVTGTIVPTEQRAVPNAVSVVTADQIEQRNLTRVDQIFRGTVPGAVAFDLGVNDAYAYVAGRGTNSLTYNPTMKTYIDGVEVVDPSNALAQLDATSIERVEVSRGPQGSTVYGSSASGGVVQVFTKKGTETGRPEFSGKVMGSAVQGPFSVGTPLRQNYSLNVTGGKSGFTYNLGGSYLHTGETAPEYRSRTLNLFGGGLLTQGPVTLALSARYTDRTFSTPFDPRFVQYTFFSKPFYLTNDFPQETIGINTTYRATDHWQHSLVLGYDGSLVETWQTQPRLTTPSDTLLSAFSSQGSRASIRYNTSYDLSFGSAISVVATAGAEYYHYNLELYRTRGATHTTGSLNGSTSAFKTPYSNRGFFGQLQAGVLDRLFLTGGLRAERNDNFGDQYGTAWQPRVGIAYLQPVGGVLLKVRGSYANAINGVDPGDKLAILTTFQNQLANPSLKPERQSGWEAGLDLQIGSRASLGVTYYNEDAKDLLQYVTLSQQTTPPTGQWQNVGVIKNRGWEFEGSLNLGRFDLRGTLSPVSSTVRQLDSTYTGAFRVGDPVTGIPRSSSGITVRWQPVNGTSAVLGMTYIGHWTNYDGIALNAYFFGSQPYRGSLRDYWIEYPSITKLKLSLSQRLTRQTSALVDVDNLGNNGRYEQTNTNLPTGRITSIGLRFEY